MKKIDVYMIPRCIKHIWREREKVDLKWLKHETSNVSSIWIDFCATDLEVLNLGLRAIQMAEQWNEISMKIEIWALCCYRHEPNYLHSIDWLVLNPVNCMAVPSWNGIHNWYQLRTVQVLNILALIAFSMALFV